MTGFRASRHSSAQSERVVQLADFVARCEAEGFNGVGEHDHPHAVRDVYVTLALTPQCTTSTALVPGDLQSQCSPSTAARVARNSLVEIAPSHISLTVAPGFLSVRSIGKSRADIATVRWRSRRRARGAANGRVCCRPTRIFVVVVVTEPAGLLSSSIQRTTHMSTSMGLG